MLGFGFALTLKEPTGGGGSPPPDEDNKRTVRGGSIRKVRDGSERRTRT